MTNYNRLEYIHRLADLKLNSQIKNQCAAFRAGLDSVVPLLWLRLFNHEELQVIIGGDTTEIDLNDLREHTVYGGKMVLIRAEENKMMIQRFVMLQASFLWIIRRYCCFGRLFRVLRSIRRSSC